MQSAAIALSAVVLAVLATSCADKPRGPGHPVGTGPFNSRGDYIEAWADNPAKWRGGDRKPTPPRTTTPPRQQQQATASTPRPTQQARPTQTAQNRPTQTAQTRPATTPQPRPQPRPQARTYTVKRGDTLSGIASRHRTTVAGLRRANGISGDLIRPGQVLRIP